MTDIGDNTPGINFSVGLFDNVDLSLETVCAPPPQNLRGRRLSQGGGGDHLHDAVAEIAVSAKDLRRVFRFKTHKLLDFVNSSVNNKSEADDAVAVEYHVFSSSWPKCLNLAQARVVENAVVYRSQHGGCLSRAEMTVAHDYLRHVARHVFNTPYGAQLFGNQRSVLGEIEHLCRSANVFSRVLGAIDCRTGTYDNLEHHHHHPDDKQRYLTSRDQSSMNVGLALMRQVLALDPDRLLQMPDKQCSRVGRTGSGGSSSSDRDVSHPIPLRANDSIALTITLHAAKGQHEIFLCRRVDPIPPRTYCVRLILQ